MEDQKIIIEDNVLPQEEFDKIYKDIRSPDFPWNLIEDGVSHHLDGSYQFTHNFFNPKGVKSRYNFILTNLYKHLGVDKLLRSKVNLLHRTKKTYEFLPFHTDFVNVTELYHTAIFYLNTNDGYTLFENGSKVDSVANRVVKFDGRTPHTGSTHTSDDRFRLVLNINYF